MTETTTIKTESLPEGLLLRPLRASDADQYHALQEQPGLFAQANPHMPYRSLDERRDWLARIGPPAIVLAAVVGDTLVGTAEIQPGRMRRAHTAVVGMSVHEAWQGRGIGKRLMAELIDIADNWLGLRRLELQVFVDNARALGLYRRFGFDIEARQRGCVVRDGALVDMYLMARLRDAIPFGAPAR